MKLMTKELEKEFEKYPLGSQDGLGGDAIVIAKYFNPVGVGTWFITEGNKLDDGDYEMFGYCHLGDDDLAELGYVRLSELENINLPFGMKIERDLYLGDDCKLYDAITSLGITPPSYLVSKNDNLEEFEIITNTDELDDEHNFTVARVRNNNHCVELHYDNGKAFVEYGTRLAPDYWKNEREEANWFNKSISEEEIETNLGNLFDRYKENKTNKTLDSILNTIDKYKIDFNAEVPFENFASDYEQDYMKSFSEFYGDILKDNNNIETIETDEISDGKYELTVYPSVGNRFSLNITAWDNLEKIVENVETIQEKLSKDNDLEM